MVCASRIHRLRRHGHVAEDLGDDVVGGDAFGFGFEIRNQAMAQGGERGGLNVLEADVKAALREGADFAGENECLRAARTAAEAEILICNWGGGFGLGMRGEHEAHGVIFHVRCDGNFAHQLHEFHERVAVEDFVDLGFRAGGGAVDDLVQFVRARIADDNLEEEAIQLRFGQWIRAFLVNRVLRCHDEERFGELAEFAARSDLFFLHGFEHGGLGLGRGAIDFVGEDEVREDRAALELKFASAGIAFHDEIRAEDVGGHEVGRELNATERHVEHFAERADEERFAKAGHAFEQNVSAAEQRDESVFNDVGVADDDLGDFCAERFVGGAEAFNMLLSVHRN